VKRFVRWLVTPISFVGVYGQNDVAPRWTLLLDVHLARYAWRYKA
jgi:hypothetical protein